MIVNAYVPRVPRPALTPAFYSKLMRIAADVHMNPEDIINVMAFESGINSAQPNLSGADNYGLLQFSTPTLRGLGYHGTREEFLAMPPEDQLDWAGKLIAMRTKVNGKSFTSAAQYHLANWLPVALQLPGIRAEDPTTVIVAQHPDHPHLPGVSIAEEASFYRSNPSLDFDHDGVITYGDLQKNMANTRHEPTFQSAVTQMKTTTGYSPSGIDNAPSPSRTVNIEDLLSRYLTALSSTQSHYLKKQAIKQLLPHDYLIKVKGDTTDAIEFARILSAAIDEELCSDASTYTDGKRVEIQTTIHGNATLCTEALLQLSDALATAFEKNASVSVVICPNKRSTCQELGISEALKYYDDFHTKRTS